MLKNVFRTDPIHLIVWSRATAWTSTRIVLLGDQPPDIKKALAAALAQHLKGRRPAESALLRKYFGTDWRRKTGVDTKHGGSEDGSKGGDAAEGDSNYGNDPGKDTPNEAYTMVPKEPVAELERPLDDAGEPEQIDTTDLLEVMDTEHAADTIEPLAQSAITLQDLGGIRLDDVVKVKPQRHKTGTVQHMYDIDIYPEDKVSEFKLKISHALKIPIFRQHVWYRTAGQSFPCSYNFLQSGATQVVDMGHVIGDAVSETICDMPVNMFLYRNKDTTKIEAYDNFTLLGNLYMRNNITEYNLVDLETFVGPNRERLAEISKSDKYQLQMLYYGFVLLYFPMMNMAAFSEYLDERRISQSYPQLDPVDSDIAYLDRQQLLMRELYALYETDENRVRKIDSTLHKSLTETTLKVSSSTRGRAVNLRILFDMFELDEKVDALRLYDQIEGKPIMLDKYLKGRRASQEKLIPGVLYFRVIVSEQPRQQLNFYLYPNGAYHIKGVWGEDQNYEFNDVNLMVDRHINPIVRKINSMARQIMYHGTSMMLNEAEKSNVKYIDISISMFWKKILTGGEFRQLKTVLDKFVAARILQEKQIDRNTVSYFFKKGMYEFDPHRIEKSALVDNYYAYLYNSDIRQKWFMLFENIRVMTVTHRYSDVKIDISGIKEDEYYIFVRYLVLLMSHFMRERGTGPSAVDDRKMTKPLSNLKEQDPHLYNLKKIYNSDEVYSKLCQKPYQPLLLTQSQYDQLDRKAKNSTTKYWNFTTQTDAYYQCPNPKYPHVRFITGKHPMNYCIPCCKITAPPDNPDDKQRKIYDQCLREHTYAKREVERSTSRYIMSYGKSIDIGRLSHLPETSLEPLFYESKEEGGDSDLIGAKYYLYGVPQNHPNAKHCGLLYCYSHAMGMNVDALVELMVTKVEKHAKNFQMLMGGRISKWFANETALAAAMRSTFAGNKAFTSDFNWNELVQDIALQFLEICTIVFEDRDTVIQLRLPDYLDNLDDLKYPKHMHLIVVHNLQTDYWNPIYTLHKDLYFRAGIIDRKLFNFQSDIIQVIMEVVRTKLRDTVHSNHITYDIMRQFITQSGRYTISKLLVTRDNLCYGINVDPVGYVPVHLSHFKFDETLDVSFRSADIEPADPARLMEFVSRYNTWVAHESERGGFIRVDVPVTRPLLERVEPIYPLLQPDRWLVTDGRAIAWQAHNLNHYIKPIAAAAAQRLARVPFQHMYYNPIAVNAVLERAEEPHADRRVQIVDAALYRNYLYQLLVLEFIQMFNRQRNTKVREQIKRIFLKTDFKQPTAKLIDDISAVVLQGFERNAMLLADVEKIKGQIVEWLLSGESKTRLMRMLDAEYYTFDMIALERLKRQPRKQIHDQLRKMASQFVEIGQIDQKNFHFPNILASCHGSDGKGKDGKGKDGKAHNGVPDYCRRGRLVISRHDLDRYLDVLADQIKNPFVEKYLFSPLFQTSLIDYFSFNSKPNEVIEIEFM